MKIYCPVPGPGAPPLLQFLEPLDLKLRRKIATQLLLLARDPSIGEPHIKHFTISKYKRLFELRTKSKIMVRIIFALTKGGDILLLEPFIKRHTRNTMQALDASLKLLRLAESEQCSVIELDINKMILEASL